MGHLQRIKPVCHRQADAFEHLFALRAADGNHQAAAIAFPVPIQRLLEDVLAGPEALAAVDEDLGLGADRHEEDGRGENESVGIEQFVEDALEIVLDAADTGLGTGVAFDAGGDREAAEREVVGPATRFLGPAERFAQKEVAVPFRAGTCRDAENLKRHRRTSEASCSLLHDYVFRTASPSASRPMRSIMRPILSLGLAFSL